MRDAGPSVGDRGTFGGVPRNPRRVVRDRRRVVRDLPGCPTGPSAWVAGPSASPAGASAAYANGQGIRPTPQTVCHGAQTACPGPVARGTAANRADRSEGDWSGPCSNQSGIRTTQGVVVDPGVLDISHRECVIGLGRPGGESVRIFEDDRPTMNTAIALRRQARPGRNVRPPSAASRRADPLTRALPPSGYAASLEPRGTPRQRQGMWLVASKTSAC